MLTKTQASDFCWAWLKLVCIRELYFTYRGEFAAQNPHITCQNKFLLLRRLISWYKRSELGFRIAIFYSSATLANAFSEYIILCPRRLIDYYSPQLCRLGGLLAAAIHNMGGIGGRPGWAWIFILEGLFTILVACVSPWIIQDFPESARFLTEAERMYITTLHCT
jgi:hypothetical protein